MNHPTEITVFDAGHTAENDVAVFAVLACGDPFRASCRRSRDYFTKEDVD